MAVVVYWLFWPLFIGLFWLLFIGLFWLLLFIGLFWLLLYFGLFWLFLICLFWLLSLCCSFFLSFFLFSRFRLTLTIDESTIEVDVIREKHILVIEPIFEHIVLPLLN